MNVEFLIGKKIDEARQYLSDAGIPWRITVEDQFMGMLITADYDPNRVSMQVVDGIVKKVSVG